MVHPVHSWATTACLHPPLGQNSKGRLKHGGLGGPGRDQSTPYRVMTATSVSSHTKQLRARSHTRAV